MVINVKILIVAESTFWLRSSRKESSLRDSDHVTTVISWQCWRTCDLVLNSDPTDEAIGYEHSHTPTDNTATR